jgi:hypothetical protein
MKRYCFDTSGLSTPWSDLADDVFTSLWDQVIARIEKGEIAVTQEIYDEMCHIEGRLGECIKANKAAMLMEINEGSWDWAGYVAQGTRMLTDHHDFISEYTPNKANDTVCLHDMTIIALAKSLGLPLVSSEKSAIPSLKKKRIPDICQLENVHHHHFVGFCQLEKIKS